jgi:hypothetical protein
VRNAGRARRASFGDPGDSAPGSRGKEEELGTGPQRTQGRRERVETEVWKREQPYVEFIAESSKLIIEAFDHQLQNTLMSLRRAARLCHGAGAARKSHSWALSPFRSGGPARAESLLCAPASHPRRG